MTYTSVYRSNDPALLAAVVEHHAARKRWSEAMEALWRELGFPEGTRVWVSGGFVVDWFGGFGPPEGTEPSVLPKGWGTSKQLDGRYMPRQNSRVGKEAHRRVQAIGEKVPTLLTVVREHGMPATVTSGLRMSTPAIQVHPESTTAPEVVWVGWGADPEAEAEAEAMAAAAQGVTLNRRDQVDRDLWERVPLSEFYALVEAGNAPLQMGGRG